MSVINNGTKCPSLHVPGAGTTTPCECVPRAALGFTCYFFFLGCLKLALEKNKSAQHMWCTICVSLFLFSDKLPPSSTSSYESFSWSPADLGVPVISQCLFLQWVCDSSWQIRSSIYRMKFLFCTLLSILVLVLWCYHNSIIKQQNSIIHCPRAKVKQPDGSDGSAASLQLHHCWPQKLLKPTWSMSLTQRAHPPSLWHCTLPNQQQNKLHWLPSMK